MNCRRDIGDDEEPSPNFGKTSIAIFENEVSNQEHIKWIEMIIDDEANLNQLNDAIESNGLTIMAYK